MAERSMYVNVHHPGRFAGHGLPLLGSLVFAPNDPGACWSWYGRCHAQTVLVMRRFRSLRVSGRDSGPVSVSVSILDFTWLYLRSTVELAGPLGCVRAV